MLEIRYNKNTGELTGWWGNRFGNKKAKLKNRPDEAIVMLDIPIPDKPLEAWLFDEATQVLIPNPDYVGLSEDEATAIEYLQKSSSVITQPEIWWLLRYFGERLGVRAGKEE